MDDILTPRTDSSFRLINASTEKIYKALITPSAIQQWKAPAGMRMEIFHYNVRADGTYRLALYYEARDHRGKSGNHSDVVKGKFLELVPERRIVESITFDSPDPAFAGQMIMTTELSQEKGGTRVSFTATNVPEGITAEDHQAGMHASLENLARFVE